MPIRAIQQLAPVTGVECKAYDFPFKRAETDGTERWDRTTLILSQVRAEGETGLGYTYGDSSTAYAARSLLAPALIGRSAFDVQRLWLSMLERVRNAGRPGIASAAIASLDIALWDLKSKLLNLPLSLLLGQVRSAVVAYGSGGFTSLPRRQLARQLEGWMKLGLVRMKIKIGSHPAQDPARIRFAKETIGRGRDLYVDANGAYARKQALRIAKTLSRYDVKWFEEPVSSDDLDGLRFIRERVPVGIEIAAGEYGYDPVYFDRMLAAQAIDVAQIDATRCLGITGFLKAAAVCEARFIPISAHTAPSLHTHLGCALPHFRHVEYFSDHATVEPLAFEGAIRPVNGMLAPDLSRPGLGLELKVSDLRGRRAA